MEELQKAIMELKRIIEKTMDGKGKEHIRTVKETMEGPINFGSINKPLNTDVYKFSITVPKDLFTSS